MIRKGNILLIGCGFFSQNIYIPIIKKLFKNENIYFFDERAELTKKTAIKFKCNYLDKLNSKILSKKNITHCVLCFDRNRSYFYCRFILGCGINLFAEKPICKSSEELKKLFLIAKKNKIQFMSSFQRMYEKKIIKLRNNIKNAKSKPIEVSCNFQSGNFRHNKKTKIRTLEIIKNIKKIKNRNKIAFLIFLNRFWHIINAINFIYPFSEFKKKLKMINFISYNITSYRLLFEYKSTNFKLVMNSNKKNGWHEKYNLKLSKKNYSAKLNAPMKFNSNKINKTPFFNQVVFFIKSKRKLEYTNIKNCINELKFIELIWKRKFSK